ncbi:hypothetical protein BVRB_027040 [Beta vulgaris subsp. vulgaris]|uniref:C3HC-type domain-containing protein n=1 Tax=Beta vulgaris subsp. vulgaris TaxID=3555 RepID=A0A0J8DSY7_BETVV|nr:hypothetical protein BVRB_027040 [Beta vulgaris subsp. vulgaris]
MTSNGDGDDLRSIRDHVRASLTTPVLMPEQRAAWIKLIRTYGERHWSFAHNAYLSPIRCARIGWECIGPDLLQCRSCQNQIKVQFSSKLKQPAIDELSKEIATKQLFLRHDQLCPFYDIKHVTPARVLPADSFTILKEFHHRHQKLVGEFSSMIESQTLRLDRVPEKLSQYELVTVLAICGWQPSKTFLNV